MRKMIVRTNSKIELEKPSWLGDFIVPWNNNPPFTITRRSLNGTSLRNKKQSSPVSFRKPMKLHPGIVGDPSEE